MKTNEKKMRQPAQKIISRIVLTALLLTTLAHAQQRPANPGNSSFAAFWNEFKAAVAKDDREAVAGMTKLPIYLANQEQMKPGFLRLYPRLFPKKVQTCFASAKPVKEYNQESYSAFCGKSIYVFARDKGQWKFTDLGADD
ncbi:MAG: hypothetical protein U0Y68_10950 [Blastocatellia bacterium]